MEVVMEEKERFELNDNDCIIDNEKNVIICDVCDVSESPKILVDLLNQQDKENQELKQSQNQVAISELEKIYNLFEPYENSQKDTILCANNGISFVDYLENQIKSLKGEE